MSNRSKGSKFELEVQKLLESEGYTCHRAYASMIPGTKFCRSNDVFNCADIVAKKSYQPTRWVQVTTGISNLQPRVKKFNNLKIWNDLDSLEIWVREPNAKWRVYQIFPEGEVRVREIFRLERGKKLIIE